MLAFERDRTEQPEPGQAPVEVPALPADLMQRAEAVMIESAATCDAAALRRAGQHLLEAVAPEVAEEALGRKLAAEERAARARMRLVVRDNGDGTHSGSFTVPDLHAAMLAKALDALCSPRATRPGEPGHHLDAEGERLPRPEQRGQAFCAFLERFPADRLPSLGGRNATVVVTIGFESLTEWWATAGLDTGGRISAGEARRLMCGAGILPAVLGGASEVLDLGREQRLFSKAQRRATDLAQPACVADGCVRPAAQCEAHHLVPWSEGGRTDLAMAVNLCSWHHHRAHDPRYDLDRHPDGASGSTGARDASAGSRRTGRLKREAATWASGWPERWSASATKPLAFSSSTRLRRNATVSGARVLGGADRLLDLHERRLDQPRARVCRNPGGGRLPDTGSGLEAVGEEDLHPLVTAYDGGVLERPGEEQVVGRPTLHADAHPGPVDLGGGRDGGVLGDGVDALDHDVRSREGDLGLAGRVDGEEAQVGPRRKPSRSNDLRAASKHSSREGRPGDGRPPGRCRRSRPTARPRCPAPAPGCPG